MRAHLPGALGGKDELLAFALQPGADNLLGTARGGTTTAERIHVGGVEEVDPALGRCIEDRVAASLVTLAAEGHGAETES